MALSISRCGQARAAVGHAAGRIGVRRAAMAPIAAIGRPSAHSLSANPAPLCCRKAAGATSHHWPKVSQPGRTKMQPANQAFMLLSRTCFETDAQGS